MSTLYEKSFCLPLYLMYLWAVSHAEHCFCQKVTIGDNGQLKHIFYKVRSVVQFIYTIAVVSVFHSSMLFASDRPTLKVRNIFKFLFFALHL